MFKCDKISVIVTKFSWESASEKILKKYRSYELESNDLFLSLYYVFFCLIMIKFARSRIMDTHETDYLVHKKIVMAVVLQIHYAISSGDEDSY